MDKTLKELMKMDEKLSLINLAGGTAVDKFDLELERVIDNILDPNSKETADRSITLTVTFKPKERDFGKIVINCKSKIAEPDDHLTQAFFVKDALGRPIAQKHNPEQLKLKFERRAREVDAGENVALIESARKDGTTDDS